MKVPFRNRNPSGKQVSESGPVAGAIQGFNPCHFLDAGRARELQKNAPSQPHNCSRFIVYSTWMRKSARGGIRFFARKFTGMVRAMRALPELACSAIVFPGTLQSLTVLPTPGSLAGLLCRQKPFHIPGCAVSRLRVTLVPYSPILFGGGSCRKRYDGRNHAASGPSRPARMVEPQECDPANRQREQTPPAGLSSRVCRTPPRYRSVLRTTDALLQGQWLAQRPQPNHASSAIWPILGEYAIPCRRATWVATTAEIARIRSGPILPGIGVQSWASPTDRLKPALPEPCRIASSSGRGWAPSSGMDIEIPARVRPQSAGSDPAARTQVSSSGHRRDIHPRWRSLRRALPRHEISSPEIRHPFRSSPTCEPPRRGRGRTPPVGGARSRRGDGGRLGEALPDAHRGGKR